MFHVIVCDGHGKESVHLFSTIEEVMLAAGSLWSTIPDIVSIEIKEGGHERDNQ